MAFLRQFRPETGQQQALAALINICQGHTEDITDYVRRFEVVCMRYVGNLLNDSTIRNYFIQGLERNSTKRDVITRRPITLADAVVVSLEVEVIDKEHERMQKRIEEPIPSFIPIIHQPSKATRLSEGKERYMTTTSTVPILQPVPLATCEPPPLVLPNMDQLQLVIKQATEGFREEMARTMKSLTDQVSNLTMTQNSRLPAYYESGQHSTGIWCTVQGCPNPADHSSQFCPLLLQHGPNSG